jgi:hypothetical protein
LLSLLSSDFLHEKGEIKCKKLNNFLAGLPLLASRLKDLFQCHEWAIKMARDNEPRISREKNLSTDFKKKISKVNSAAFGPGANPTITSSNESNSIARFLE